MDPIEAIIGCVAAPTHRGPIALNLVRAWLVDGLTRRRFGRRILAMLLDAAERHGRSARADGLAEYICRARSAPAWADDPLLADWRVGSDPLRRRIAEFLTEVGTGVPNQAPVPIAVGELVIVLPGVEARALSRFTWPSERPATVIDLSGSLPGAAAYRVISPDLRSREIVESWFERAHHFADRASEAIVAALAASPVEAQARAHAVVVTFQIRHEIAWLLQRLRALQGIMADLAPPCVRLIEGHYPADVFVAQLAELGLTGDRIRIDRIDRVDPRPWVRRRAEARAGVAGPIVAAESAGAALSAVIATMKPVWCPWSPTVKSIVAADLRDEKDFRHRASILALLAEITPRRPALILQPYSNPNLRLVRVTLGLLRRFGLRVKPVFVRVPHLLIPIGADTSAWRAPLLRAVEAALEADGSGSPAECAAVLEASGIVVAGFLPGALATLRDLDRLMSKGPANLYAVPSGKPIGILSLSAARAQAIPSIEVQTLLIGTSRRDSPPIGDHVAVVDDAQAELYVRRFAIARAAMVVAGREDLTQDRLWAQAQARSGGAGNRHRVLFATQPLIGLSQRTLEAVLKACTRRSDVTLVVGPHPDERGAILDAYRALIAAYDRDGSVILADNGISRDDILAADVVVTIVSNVGLRAAIMGRDVVVVDLSEGNLPIRFDQSGIALYADGVDALVECLDGLFDRPSVRAALAQTRDAYLRRNPQFLSGSTSTRIVDYLEAEAPPGRTNVRLG